MNNSQIKESFIKWSNNDLSREDLSALLNGVIHKLLDKKDDDLSSIIRELPRNLHGRFYNLISICCSHQILATDNGKSMSGQYQVIIPVIFYPNGYDDNLKVIHRISPMIINKYASDVLEMSGLDHGEFYAYPHLIPESEFELKFSEIFHLPFTIMDRDINKADLKIDITKPLTYYIYGRLFLPNDINIFTPSFESTFQNPLDFYDKSKEIQEMIEAFLKVHDSEMKVLVGSPSTVPHILGNANGFNFIADILMKYAINDYELGKDDIVAEVSEYQDEITLLFYANKKCVMVYKIKDRFFATIEGEHKYFDVEYYKKILEELGMKNVRLSKRKFGDDFNAIIGQDILSIS